ncbi:hypothetical protein [Microbacterium pygmaeum]|uniref:Lipoprotein n=1 Tax=Microbacterium pygmaeum TaxID=370764 RepID=A0A1G8D8H6_9MICO|nr:hypothetical protein [Microbacterium pygmaeum]SDH53580.1 hypothetical protein SAMN04489810_3270 [Microbacterium pygmaeum]
MPRRIARSAPRLVVITTLSAVALLGLAGCTGAPAPSGTGGGSSQNEDAPGDGGQSTQDACALVQETISDATAEFETSGAEDPAAVAEAMNAAAEKLAGAALQVTNDEVAALLPALRDMFAQAGEVMTAVTQGDVSKVEDLTELGTKFQETSESFQEICTP